MVNKICPHCKADVTILNWSENAVRFGTFEKDGDYVTDSVESNGNMEYFEECRPKVDASKLRSTQRLVEVFSPLGLRDERVISHSSLCKMSKRKIESLSFDLNIRTYDEQSKEDMVETIWDRYK